MYFEWPFTFFNSHFSFLHTIGNTMLVSSPFQVSILQWIHRHNIMKITKTFFRYVIPISTMGLRAFLQGISMSVCICMNVYVCVVLRMNVRIVLRLISCMDNDQTLLMIGKLKSLCNISLSPFLHSNYFCEWVVYHFFLEHWLMIQENVFNEISSIWMNVALLNPVRNQMNAV